MVITGGPRDNRIGGTPEDDQIDALAGSETVRGRGGGGLIFGREDSNQLYGDTGDDTICGGDEPATYEDLIGGRSDDLLVAGGRGDDAGSTVVGGRATDTLVGAVVGTDLNFFGQGDTRRGARSDVIEVFEREDALNAAGIAADIGWPSDQAFTYIDLSAEFTGLGQHGRAAQARL